jgi:hypothetical protein
MKKQHMAKTVSTSAERQNEVHAMLRRGLRSDADYVNLVYDQIHAHRLAAAASPLPRVRANLLALADKLEVMLDPGERPPPAVSTS